MIYDSVVLHGDVRIHESAVVEPYCILGSPHGPLVIPKGSIIRSHSVIEGGSTFGSRLETGHYTLIRTNTEVGENLRIGSYSSLEGGGIIGDYVRIHGRCEMTKGTLRHFTRMHLNSVMTDNKMPPSSHQEHAIMDEGSVICAAVIVVAGVKIGIGGWVGATTVVSKDVPPGMALIGKTLRPVTDLEWGGYRHPWTSYYLDEYPKEARGRIQRLNVRILKAAKAS